MAEAEVWSTIHAERAALAADLAKLNELQWNTPSLCVGWTVRDVLSHMTATASTSLVAFVPKIVASGFKLGTMQNKDIAKVEGSSPKETLENFRHIIGSTKSPPGPKVSWLGETIVHAEDIRRPLGIAHDYPVAATAQVAEFYTRSNMVIGGKRRIEGLQLRATDTDWTHGEGPEVAGPVLSLVLAITGRKVACDDLKGDGVATLRARD